MKDKKYSILIAFVAAALVSAGCSWLPTIESRKVNYKSAGKLPPLEVPPDLTAPAVDERYVVPDISPAGSATFSAYSRERGAQPKPGSTGLLPEQDKARIERAGAQRWLVVAGAPETVWPVVKDFWQEMGFLIKLETPEAGVMETDWAENRAKIPEGGIRGLLGRVLDSAYSTAERDKFRTRLERGSEPGTSEIYISHRGMQEVYETEGKDRTIWQPRPADEELEAEMLRRLMVRFGVQEERAKAQLVVEKQPERAKIGREPDGSTTLAVDDNFDRAWRRVGLALDRVGFTVEDRDRSKGLYYVRYVAPETDNKPSTGILSRLKFWGSDSDNKTQARQYRILVTDAGSGSRIGVLNKDGNSDKTEAASRIVGLLYEQLK